MMDPRTNRTEIKRDSMSWAGEVCAVLHKNPVP